MEKNKKKAEIFDLRNIIKIKISLKIQFEWCSDFKSLRNFLQLSLAYFGSIPNPGLITFTLLRLIN